jgi:DNA-binding CsgD family transcriptional regulator
MQYSLYLITRADNERYIGITSRGIDRRAWEHKNGYGSSTLKGMEFSVQELIKGPESLISNLEDHFILSYKCTLNKVRGGKFGHGLEGSKNGRAKLTENDIPTIMNLYAEGKSQQQIADIYNVTRGSIQEITSGFGWKHVTRETAISKRNIVDKDSRQQIKLLWEQGVSNSDISKSLDIKYNTVYSYTKDLPVVSNKQKNTRKIDDVTIAKILQLNKDGVNSSKIAKELGIGRTTVNRYISGERK